MTLLLITHALTQSSAGYNYKQREGLAILESVSKRSTGSCHYHTSHSKVAPSTRRLGIFFEFAPLLVVCYCKEACHGSLDSFVWAALRYGIYLEFMG